MAEHWFSRARSHPQRLVEGEPFRDGHEKVADFPLCVANVKNTNSLERKNKNHKGVSSTVLVSVATFFPTNF